jgi:hypothetical protein
MFFSILICLAAFSALVILLRKTKLSFGLPIAYLFGLLLIHLPGALVHSFPWSKLRHDAFTATGIMLTSVGALCFVGGVWLARHDKASVLHAESIPRPRFWMFCLLAGWSVVYLLIPLVRIPSFGAAVEKGAAVWMLGVILGLRTSLGRGSVQAFFWAAAMLIYPILMLLLGGFLSYGATTTIICLAPLMVSSRNRWRLAIGFTLTCILGFNLFLSYFENRTAIRSAVWGGADFNSRVDAASSIFRDLAWFDPMDGRQLGSVDQRLNQNLFVGLAADRLERGRVGYLNGRSVWEGVLALVPRAIWPDKPVYGGSPKIVSEMTGLKLSRTTSFGVGNVMEFYINFGMPGVVVGFLLLGWAIGRLDLLAAAAEQAGDFSRLFRCFLPAVALIQPNGSIVELCGGVAAAWVAAIGWGWAWSEWSTWAAARRGLQHPGAFYPQIRS